MAPGRAAPIPVGPVAAEQRSRSPPGTKPSRKRPKKIRRARLHNQQRDYSWLAEDPCKDEHMLDLNRIWNILDGFSLQELYMAISFLMQVLCRILSVWEPEGRFESLKTAPNAVTALVFFQTGVLSETMMRRLRGLHVELFATASERAQQSAQSAAASASSSAGDPAAGKPKSLGAEAVEEHFRTSFSKKDFLHYLDSLAGNWPPLDSSWKRFQAWASDSWQNGGWNFIAQKKPYANKAWEILKKVAAETSLETLRSEAAATSAAVADKSQPVLVDIDLQAEAEFPEAEVAEAEASKVESEYLQARSAQSGAALNLLLNDCEWNRSIPASHEEDTFRIIKQMKHYVEIFCQRDIYELILDKDGQFPKSLRAWAVLPMMVLQVLERRRNLPRFLSHPTDGQIRPHANLAPEKFSDPGNIILDQAFLILGLWRFVQTMSVSEILAIPYKEYGSRGER